METDRPAPLRFPRLPMIAFAASILLGLVVGALYPMPEWSLATRLIVFGSAGGFCGFILTFWRMLM